EVSSYGVKPRTATDSELIAHLIAQSPGDDWLSRMRQALPKLYGAYCLVLLARDQVFAARDPWGIRPLVLGRLPSGGWVAASETCALDTIGATYIRDVSPGELLAIGPRGVHAESIGQARRAACSFEHIYFARPDSVVDGRLVYATRERMGEELA